MIYLKKNLGSTDRAVRFFIGVFLLYLAFFIFENNLILKIVLIIFGVISLVESFISYCGIYQLLKINTFRRR